MTGQDAIKSANSFNEHLNLDGVILTKLDGDTRGGAALSLRHVTGKPIKFAGIGEQLDKLEEFHPDRMASRILGMGDIVSLVEKAQDAFDEKEAMEMHDKLMQNKFTVHDFLKQMQTIKKMGSIKDMMGMIPGLGNAVKDVDESQIGRIEAIILSMTPAERDNGEILDGSRRKRIAAGCGQTVQDVNQFFNQFKMMQKMMSGMSKGGGMFSGMKNMLKMGKNSLGGGGAPGLGDLNLDDMPNAMPGAGLSAEEKKKKKLQRKQLKAKRKRSRGK